MSRKRTARTLSISHPTRPRNFTTQSYATMTAIVREIAYPQALQFDHRWWQWATPPPLGQSLVLVTYMAVITLFLTLDSIVDDAYYWERIGFRAAWVSVTQVPFVFLLAGKVNIISSILGSSYIDVNWLHRWASRILFVTVTVHGSFFLREWIRADFVETELEMMPMVKYGLGLWGVLAWMNVISILPLRRLCYEFFVLQHLVSGVVFLWLLSVHIPAYAMYNLWIAVTFLLLGRSIRSWSLLYRNLTLKRRPFGSSAGKPTIGYSAELQPYPGDTTKLTIRGVHFSWKAGQHVFIWCPSFGPLEDHPFTVSNVSKADRENGTQQLELVIRTRSGFTQRLRRRAIASQGPLKVCVTGPFGSLPSWSSFETLVLISASTGASFTLPVLQSVLDQPCCVRRIDCLLLFRHESLIEAYLPQLRAVLLHSKSAVAALSITIAINDGKKGVFNTSGDTLKRLEHLATSARTLPEVVSTPPSENTIHECETGQAKEMQEKTIETQTPRTSTPDSLDTTTASLHCLSGRPDISSIIRHPVEASAGETSVVVCAGKSLSSTVRNCVASLSDDRAVHKGTGAQGIHLHVEGFGG